MTQEIQKLILIGQRDVLNTHGYSIEDIRSDYGFNSERYTEINRKLADGYKKGVEDAIRFIEQKYKIQITK